METWGVVEELSRAKKKVAKVGSSGVQSGETKAYLEEGRHIADKI
jgi:hypothetical protein